MENKPDKAEVIMAVFFAVVITWPFVAIYLTTSK
jgi:hypothetical protein